MSVVRRATEAETTTRTHTHHHHHSCVLVGSVRTASEPTSCLPPRCRHPAAAAAATMWSASMPSPCLTLLYGGHDGMKWDAAVVAGVWRAYLGA